MTSRRGNLPPDPDGLNAQRAAWARRACLAFAHETGQAHDGTLGAEDGWRELIGDLLCDLRHLANVEGLAWHALIADATALYREETASDDDDEQTTPSLRVVTSDDERQLQRRGR